MHISSLLIDTGDDPDRPRPGRLWLRNRYRVHQRLCMGFPSAEQQAQDADFLSPFDPNGFAVGHVHVDRSARAGFLFRVDPQPGSGAVVLVQSAMEPDWDYAFRNAGCLLAAPPQVKPFAPAFEEGQRVRFRLEANATRKVGTKTGPDGAKNYGRRVPVPAGELSEWLARRAAPAGLEVEEGALTVVAGYAYFSKKMNGEEARLRSVRYEGTAEVTDAVRLCETIGSGIGPGKAFGFGLLSVAPG